MNFESRNPATGELLGSYPEHNKAEIEVRLQRAWDGWRHWSRTPLKERIAFLTGLAELLEDRAETYGRLITAEMGKPVADSIFEIKKSAWDACHLAEAGEAYLKPQPVPGLPAQIIYESIGPIFSVQPWNVPSGRCCASSTPQPLSAIPRSSSTPNRSRAAPRRWGPWCATPVARKGFMSTLQSGLRRVRQSSRIRGCGPPPSPAASEPAAPLRRKRPRAGKRVVLELGGSDPFIVLADADLARAVQLAVASRYFNNGEGCICVKRFLVAESLFDDFTREFVEQSKALPNGRSHEGRH